MYVVRILTQFMVCVFVLHSAAARFGYAYRPSRLAVVLAALSVLWLALKRTTWLPFLGPTVMPSGILKPYVPPRADFQVIVKAPCNAVRVIYWGAILGAKHPVQAYGGYVNAGIADVVNGYATLRLHKPKAYGIRSHKLPPHVHYRWINASGMLGSVKTIEV